MEELDLPVLDLASLLAAEASGDADAHAAAEAALAAQLREAATTTGFFVVENHGVDAELTYETYERARAFFCGLDDAQKRTVLVQNSRGYTPVA